jgi:hypothetical protein
VTTVRYKGPEHENIGFFSSVFVKKNIGRTFKKHENMLKY